MPYESTRDLPSRIKDRLSPKKQRQWLAVFNSIYSKTKNEGRAFAGANAAVKTEKTSPSLSSVHVPNADEKLTRKAESYDPPESARNNAKRVLRWKEKYGDEVKGMTRVGWTRANQLASGESLSLDTVKRMAQFARHKKNSKIDPKYKTTPWKDAGYVAWLGWGGDSGVNWAKRISDRSVSKSNGARSLYAFRPLLNAEDVIQHYKKQGVETLLLPDDMHCTVAYSRDPIRWNDYPVGESVNMRVEGGPRSHQVLGGKAFTLCFDSPSMVASWLDFRMMGAGFDYPAYQPHVTLTYSAPEVTIEPYSGPLIFGDIEMQEVNPPDTFTEKRQMGDD